MSLRCLVLVVCLFLAAESASIKSKNIPVEVIYEKSNPSYYDTRNLDAKPQLSPDDFLKLKLSDDIINEGKEDIIEAQVDEVSNEPHGNPYGVRNLDEKIQLSPEELGQTLKFVPNTVENENDVKPEQPENDESLQEAKPEDNSLFTLLKKAEEIAYSGINSIKNNIDKASEVVTNAKPTQEAWEKLNQTLEQFFDDQYKRINLRQDKPPENQNNNENTNQNNNQNQFFQNFINTFMETVNNWWSGNFQQNNNQKPQGSEDEQQGGASQGGQNQGPLQGFFNFFSNGVTQIANNMNNLYGQNSNGTTGQEDTGTDGNNNFFGNIVSTVNQFFNPANQGNKPAQASNNQSDTGVQPPPGIGGLFQQGFNQVINNFRPTTTTKAPVQGDEGTASSTTTQSSNIFGSIGQAIQNNFFGSTQAPQGGAGGGSGGSNPIVSGAQAIGSQFGQVIGGQGGSGSGGGSNPFVSGAEAIGSQFGQLGGQGGAGGQGGTNPITSGAQAIGSQIGQFVGQGGNNPLESVQNAIGGSTAAAASSTEKGKVSNEKSEDVTPSPVSGSTENTTKEEKVIEITEKVE